MVVLAVGIAMISFSSSTFSFGLTEQVHYIDCSETAHILRHPDLLTICTLYMYTDCKKRMWPQSMLVLCLAINLSVPHQHGREKGEGIGMPFAPSIISQ